MRKRITRNRYVLFFLVFFISLGFAYLSTQLSIHGNSLLKGNTWNIHFEDVVVVENTADNPTPTISNDLKSVTYSTVFEAPGDIFSFNVDVVNSGTLDGMIDEILNDGLTNDQKKYINIEYKYANGDPFEEHFVILKGCRKTINVTIEYKYDIDEEDLLLADSLENLIFSINYTKADESAYSVATFLPGEDLCDAMIELSHSTPSQISMYFNPSNRRVSPSFLNEIPNATKDSISYEDGVTYVSSFKKSSTLPNNLSSDNIVSTNDSESPIYMWFDLDENEEYLGTIYWYSDADVVYLNEISNDIFYDSACTFDYLTDISGLANVNTIRTLYFDEMFSHCAALSDLSPISNWNMSKALTLVKMFNADSSITNLSFLSNWSVSSVLSVSHMFSECTGLTNVSEIRNWNAKKLCDMSYMFSLCDELLTIEGFNNYTLENVNNLMGLFDGCTKLTTVNGFNNIKYGYNSWNYPFESHSPNTFIHFRYVFNDCSSLTTINGFNNMNIRNSSIFNNFDGCTSLKNINGFNNIKFINSEVSDFFSQNGSLFKIEQLSGFNNWELYSSSASRLLIDQNNLTSITGMNNFFIDSDSDLSFLFMNCSQMDDFSFFSNWTIKCPSVSSVFGNTAITDLDFLENINVKYITDMSGLFSGCTYLSDITGISNWNVKNVTNFDSLFYNCSSLTDARCLNGWNINSNASLTLMFRGSGLTFSTKPTWYTGSIN